MINDDQRKKITFLYAMVVVAFIIFLGSVLSTVVSPRKIPSLTTKKFSKAKRGSIISADGFHVAITKKLYKAEVNNRYIDPNKRELFIQLFSIYSGMKPEDIDKKLKSRKSIVILSYSIAEKEAQYLKKLSRELRRYKVFMELKNIKTGIRSIHGLTISESGESRIYPYGDVLTPIIGHPRKVDDEDGYTKVRGVKGIEHKFNEELLAKQNGLSRGSRDVAGYIILDKDSFTKANIDGLDIKLTIPIAIQIKIEKICDTMKKELKAKEVMVAVMESKSGKVFSMASSNRFLPKKIKRSDYSSLNSGMTEYSFEPGSVMKPITYALLIDAGLTTPMSIVNGHEGRFKIGRKVITDEHKMGWMSAENAIVHSSNIAIAQLAQSLSGKQFYDGLENFGFSQKSTYDLAYEKVGKIPSIRRLDNEIYKATCSYGYGMKANLMQLLRAYSAFSNSGEIIYPQLVSALIDESDNEIKLDNGISQKVISSATASKVAKALIKTVNKGTGKKARTAGLVIGGKTGTAHIVEKGKYVKKYNTAFIGFVNDKHRSYTMGVVVVQPTSSQFASQTAVPLFKKVVDVMIEDSYLEPSI